MDELEQRDFDCLADRARGGSAVDVATLMRISLNKRSFFARRAREQLAILGVIVVAQAEAVAA
jgi:hypothetical protein